MEGSEKESGVKCVFDKAVGSPGEKKQADDEDAAGCKIRTHL